MHIVRTISTWFRRREHEAERERPSDLSALPPAPDGARPAAGTMGVQPLRPPAVGGFGSF